MIIEGCNVRETESKLWIPRRNQKVIDILDAQYERTNPTELMWNKEKPKQNEPENEIYSLAEDMDLDGEYDDEQED